MVTGKNGFLKLGKDNKWTSYIDSVNTTYPDLVRAIHKGSKNQFWVGNVRGDLYSLNPITKEFKFITNIKTIIITIYEDSYGLVWFGGESTGRYCYDPLKDSINLYHLIFDDSSTIIGNSFISFYEDKEGTLWIGCENGLVRYLTAEIIISHVTTEMGIFLKEKLPDVYRGSGFPGADDLGNMFQFYRDFEQVCNATRDVARSRALHPGLQSFDAWLARHAKRIPLE